MKTIASILIALCLFTGCATNRTQNQRVASAAKVAAYVGTYEFLRDNPGARPHFVVARDALLTIEQSDHVDLATLLAIINQLPVKELRSDRAVLIITSATILLSDYAGALPVEQLDELKPIAKAIREGIDLGLGQHQSQIPATPNSVLIYTPSPGFLTPEGEKRLAEILSPHPVHVQRHDCGYDPSGKMSCAVAHGIDFTNLLYDPNRIQGTTEEIGLSTDLNPR